MGSTLVDRKADAGEGRSAGTSNPYAPVFGLYPSIVIVGGSSAVSAVMRLKSASASSAI